MKQSIVRFALIAAGLVASTPLSSCAQDIRKSQLASVSQMVGTARIEIVYRRPVARGRKLFGFLVPYGDLWSPSADSAAVFSTTKDLVIAGGKLPAGKYSVWAIPDKASWTIVFSSATPAFHLRYTEGKDVLRVKATPRTGDHMETLAFYFPMVDGDSAELDLHWGKTIVPMSIKASQ
jgi:Protein of unknown function (DUF2911).